MNPQTDAENSRTNQPTPERFHPRDGGENGRVGGEH
jgi:hypothetical protein